MLTSSCSGLVLLLGLTQTYILLLGVLSVDHTCQNWIRSKKNKTKQPSHLHFLLSHIYWFISHYFSSLAAYPLSWLREALSLQMKHVAFSLLLKGKGSETGCSELGWWKGPAVLTVINVSFRCQGTLWIYIKAEKMSSIMNGFSVLFSIFQSHTSLKANLIFPKKSNVLVLWMFWYCECSGTADPATVDPGAVGSGTVDSGPLEYNIFCPNKSHFALR